MKIQKNKSSDLRDLVWYKNCIILPWKLVSSHWQNEVFDVSYTINSHLIIHPTIYYYAENFNLSNSYKLGEKFWYRSLLLFISWWYNMTTNVPQPAPQTSSSIPSCTGHQILQQALTCGNSPICKAYNVL